MMFSPSFCRKLFLQRMNDSHKVSKLSRLLPKKVKKKFQSWSKKSFAKLIKAVTFLLL
jgi:hypothetical protein